MTPALGRRPFLARSLAAGLTLALGRRARGAPVQSPPLPDVDIAPLFTPFAIGRYQSSNRFVMAPMSVGECTAAGAPTTELIEHYEQRARGGVGLIITGGTIVDHPLGAADTDVGRMTAATVDAWQAVTTRVHAQGAGIFCQLWHQGPLTQPGIGPRRITRNGRTVVTKASPEDLESVIEAFGRSARLAQAAGFDGVEIHGAHGYLLDSYLRTAGVRADDAGDLTPARFVYRLVKAVRAAVGARFPIGFRFSRWSNVRSSGPYLESAASIEQTLVPLKQAGVDVFHASRGYGPFWPPEFRSSPLTLAGWCRRVTGMPTITVGHVGLDPQQFFGRAAGNLQTLVEQFAERQFDLVAVGRALLNNPDWVDMLRRREYAALMAAGPAE